MNDENMEMETPETPEEELETEPEESVEPESTEEADTDDKQLKSALAQKDHFREKFEKTESEKKKLEEKLNKLTKENGISEKSLDVEDYIDISASLEGLDQKEKEYLAKEHKLSGKSLSEIRKDEDFQLWQSAYRAKVEKDKSSLAPSGTQDESGAPQTLTQRLANAKSIDEKEEILIEAGLYKSYKKRPDARRIENLK